MKFKIWNLLVLTVVILAIISYLLLFQENKVNPTLLGIPFAFWTGFLVTVLVVIATFLGSRFFPHDEPKKP
jgi:hypothetical protein